ncbi:putative methyltransferase [Thozetella sp. PMI_491]|nr:putative methyltransferase [Thozetella sp. PMI_491]
MALAVAADLEVSETVYSNSSEPPEDLIKTVAQTPDKPKSSENPSYGLDSPVGLVLSSFLSPLYLYATLRGKFEVWDELLGKLPRDVYLRPTLDLGCGRGMVLLKIAALKKSIADRDSGMRVSPAYGIDIFNKGDQSGNSAVATYKNVASAGVLDFTVLHNASFAEQLPFADGVFSLITASLSIHNAEKQGRIRAIKEAARVCAPGGKLIVVDLSGFFNDHSATLKGEGWNDITIRWAGMRMMYGVLPCQILTGTKP